MSEPRIIKKGFLGGKQRVLCKDCGRKFVTTCGRLHYNSHQSEASWSINIVDTLNAIPFHETAAQTDCSEDTVFHMRHKFLLLLEQLLFEKGEVMEKNMEIDETYLPDSFKGIQRTE